MAWVEQRFEGSPLEDVKRAVREEIRSLSLERRVTSGQSVAVAVGSRGIGNLAAIVEQTLRELEGLGLNPFVVPAMGSHGGATAEGQRAVLASLGVTEDSMQVQVRSSMDTRLLGPSSLGLPVHIDAAALQADHIVAVNRIKAHTKFKAPIESGLMKMLAVGLGKHAGASLLHRLAIRHSLEAVILDSARTVLAEAPVLFGMGVVENGLGEPHRVQAFLPQSIEEGEAGLLALAKELAPKIPFKEVDLLIVDQIGKDISGTGMDTNVTGRNRDILGDFTAGPGVKRILIRDLSPGTKGNALGIGLADFCVRRAVQKMDLEATYTNAMTGISPEKAAIPMHLPTDREAICSALHSLGDWRPEAVRVVRIRDTLHLTRLQVSEALTTDLPETCSLLSSPQAMAFDAQGNLPGAEPQA